MQLSVVSLVTSAVTTMRYSYVLLFLCTVPLSQAQEGPQNVPPKRKEGQLDHSARFFRNLDADRNGVVSREEFENADRLQDKSEDVLTKLFSRLDKDGDGVITRKEIRPQSGSPFPQGVRPHELHKILRQVDLNKDRSISFAEFSQYERFARLNENLQRKIFERLDRNGNGSIDREDRANHQPSHETYAEFDENNNGELSWEEYSTMPHLKKMPEKFRRKSFERIDTNGDEILSLSEFIKATSSRNRPERERQNRGNPRK